MRVSKEQAAANRERILDAAARLFRERGIAGVGVDALTEAAGMTHGGLYSHFGSKERLAAEALARAMASGGGRTASAATLAEFVEAYLSPNHRDAPGTGCVIAALGGEVRRHDAPVRENFTAGVRRMARRIADLLPGRASSTHDDDAALGIAATLVGALVLARAVNDPALSDRILAAAGGLAAGAGEARTDAAASAAQG